MRRFGPDCRRDSRELRIGRAGNVPEYHGAVARLGAKRLLSVKAEPPVFLLGRLRERIRLKHCCLRSEVPHWERI